MDRLDQNNHTVDFPTHATGILDSFPCTISTPSDWHTASKFFQGKYGCCVFKIQIIIDFNGQIVWFSLPHLGTRPDPKMWEGLHPRFLRGEYVLADGAYVSCSHCFVPYKALPNQVLTRNQDHVNAVMQNYRARVEHVIGLVENFELFRSKSRMGIEITMSCAKVCIHATALHLREQTKIVWRYPETMLSNPQPH